MRVSNKFFKKLLQVIFIFLFVINNKNYSQEQVNLLHARGFIQLALIVYEAQIALTNLVIQAAGSGEVNTEEIEAIQRELVVVNSGVQQLSTLAQQATTQNQANTTLINVIQFNQEFLTTAIETVNAVLQGEASPEDLRALEYLRNARINFNLSTAANQVFTDQIEPDVGESLGNQLGANKDRPVKFDIPGGYLGAEGFAQNPSIEPGVDSADAGLTGILDASIEVSDSLLGSRSKLVKALQFYRENLACFIDADLLYKKDVKLKSVLSNKNTKIISKAGSYTLQANLDGGVIINADNVILNLDGCQIYSNKYPVIIVAEGKKNIVIKNGTICGGKTIAQVSAGILVKKGSASVTIQDIQFLFCKKGVRFDGDECLPITDCQVRNCTFVSNEKTVSLDYTKKVEFCDCHINNCFYKKIELDEFFQEEVL